MNYTVEEKVRVVRLYLDGVIEYPPNATPQQKENIRKKIKKWVGVYKAHGEEGLEPKKKSYSYEDKKYCVERLLAGDSQYQVAFSLGTTSTKQVRKWLRIYRECGFEGLKKDGNKTKYFNIKKTNATKLKEAEEEISFLRSKIRELNIELEYVKKLNALVSKRRNHQILKNT